MRYSLSPCSYHLQTNPVYFFVEPFTSSIKKAIFQLIIIPKRRPSFGGRAGADGVSPKRKKSPARSGAFLRAFSGAAASAPPLPS
jgi:hypothetical protein